MIPRKLSDAEHKRRRQFIDSLPKPDLRNMSLSAILKSVIRFGRKSKKRKDVVGDLRRNLDLDRRKGWHVSFHSDLRGTNIALGTDLVEFIKLHAPKGNVLEIGCGDGTTTAQLQQRIPGVKFSALGLRISPDWMTHENYRKIDWHVGHVENLARLRKAKRPESYDVAFSSLGLTHANDIWKAIEEIRPLLKKGGFLLINIQVSYNITPSEFEKLGFERVWFKNTAIPVDQKLRRKILSRYFYVGAFCLRKK